MDGLEAGRPELPVDRTVPACAALADFLRARRKAAGMTYRRMAELAGGKPSAATFERAASGSTVPAYFTVQESVYLTVTGEEMFVGLSAPLGRGRELWLRARRATRAPYYVHTVPDPRLVSSAADFSRALRDQHIWGGVPTAGEMERAAGPGGLPRTTAHRIIKGTMLPVDPHQATAFLRACDADPLTLPAWMDAGHRVTGAPSWHAAAEEMMMRFLAEKSITLTDAEMLRLNNTPPLHSLVRAA
ncbi:hypothetical protein [Streptomyces sp. NRRL F-5123]|uniref:hypothetical protein n=1 Tax=Streptomyces sp. NRRL F-5123 TaxID=1463856 RepID=UPI000AA3E44D|nr:hypothetical protein [Streptomyces sp. NRRL F-5123]